MNRATLPCLAALALAGVVGAGFHAVATAEDCYGLNSARACATVYPENLPYVTTTDSVDECVHLGSSCQPVSVPLPGVEYPDGQTVVVECYVPGDRCSDIVTRLTPVTAGAQADS